jgi:hypothetical protein
VSERGVAIELLVCQLPVELLKLMHGPATLEEVLAAKKATEDARRAAIRDELRARLGARADDPSAISFNDRLGTWYRYRVEEYKAERKRQLDLYATGSSSKICEYTDTATTPLTPLQQETEAYFRSMAQRSFVGLSEFEERCRWIPRGRPVCIGAMGGAGLASAEVERNEPDIDPDALAWAAWASPEDVAQPAAHPAAQPVAQPVAHPAAQPVAQPLLRHGDAVAGDAAAGRARSLIHLRFFGFTLSLTLS